MGLERGVPPIPSRYPMLEKQLWAEGRVDKGLDLITDPADIDDGALTDAKNARVRFDKTSRRFGEVQFTPVDSDTSRILKLSVFKASDGTIYLIKLTPTGPRFTNLGAWFGPAGTALVGTASDRFSVAVAQNLFVFANNGKDFVQQLVVTPTPGTFGRLGNAPKAKFVTGFYNRIVVANYTDPLVGTPATLGWSGDSAPTQFDPLVDPSAGISPLLESPGDYADFISGVFGFTNVLTIMRERSIWLATKQPIGTDPFFFSASVSGIGSNCPYTIVVIPNGLVFVDTITGTVWAYELGSAPERIGLKIEKDLVKAIFDPSIVFGSYSPLNNEYTAAVPIIGTNVVKCWTYNFVSKAWSYDELVSITEISDSIALPTITTIDQLVGTIDGLVGSIDSLSSTVPVSSTRFLAYGGDVLTIDELLGTIDGLTGTIDSLVSNNPSTLLQENPTVDTDNGSVYETIIASKDFTFPQIDQYVAETRVEYIAQKSGTMFLEYSKDGGKSWKTMRTEVISTLNVPQLLKFAAQYKARRFRFRVRAISGLFDITNYEVHVFLAAESRKGQL